jgi:hypothetical protein
MAPGLPHRSKCMTGAGVPIDRIRNFFVRIPPEAESHRITGGSLTVCWITQAIREALSGTTCSPGSVAGRPVLGSCSTVAY